MSGAKYQVSGARCQVPGVRCKCQVPGVKCGRRQVSGVRCERCLDASWELLRRLLAALGCFLRVLERLLGGSQEALGRLLEASKRHLGPQTVKGRIFGRFLKKIGNFGDPCWRLFNIQNRIFEVPRGLPRRS